MSERTTTRTLASFLAITAGPASLIPLVHAGPLTTQTPSAGQAGGIFQLTAMHQQAVTDREWTQRLIHFMELSEGKLPPLEQMLGVKPALPGGSMATPEGQKDIEYEYCATWASYMVMLTYHSFGLPSPFHGGEKFGFNVPGWSIIRVNDNGTNQGTSLQQVGQETGRWHDKSETPKPGWLLLFDFGHVEIVKKVIGNQIILIGGNTGPKDAEGHRHVARGQASVNDGDIVGYVDPSPHQGAVRISVSPRTNHAATPQLGNGLAIPGAGFASSQTTSGNGGLQVPGTSFLAQTSTESDRTPKADARAATRGRLTDHQRRAIGDTQAQQDWLLEFVYPAIYAQQKYGIPASLTLAQMINEGGWINGSELAMPPNFNPFGIKELHGYGVTRPMPTKEQAADGTWSTIHARFAKFNSYSQAFGAHAHMFVDPTLPYLKHFDIIRGKSLTPELVEEYTRAVAPIYATSHTYADDLIAIMRSLDLYRYNTVKLQAPASQPASSDLSSEPDAQTPVPDVAMPESVAGDAPAVAVPLPSLDLPAFLQGDGPAMAVPGASAAAVPPAPTQAAVRSGSGRAVAILATLDANRQGLYLPLHVRTQLQAEAGSLLANQRSYKQIAERTGVYDARLVAALHWVNTHGNLDQSAYVEGELLSDSGFETPEAALLAASARLLDVAKAVYGLRLEDPRDLTVEQLAQAFAAYRWGSVLRDAPKPMTALALPYATKGLSLGLSNLGWPRITGAPEHGPYPHKYGALPVVYHLGYPVVM